MRLTKVSSLGLVMAANLASALQYTFHLVGNIGGTDYYLSPVALNEGMVLMPENEGFQPTWFKLDEEVNLVTVDDETAVVAHFDGDPYLKLINIDDAGLASYRQWELLDEGEEVPEGIGYVAPLFACGATPPYAVALLELSGCIEVQLRRADLWLPEESEPTEEPPVPETTEEPPVPEETEITTEPEPSDTTAEPEPTDTTTEPEPTDTSTEPEPKPETSEEPTATSQTAATSGTDEPLLPSSEVDPSKPFVFVAVVDGQLVALSSNGTHIKVLDGEDVIFVIENGYLRTGGEYVQVGANGKLFLTSLEEATGGWDIDFNMLTFDAILGRRSLMKRQEAVVLSICPAEIGYTVHVGDVEGCTVIEPVAVNVDDEIVETETVIQTSEEPLTTVTPEEVETTTGDPLTTVAPEEVETTTLYTTSTIEVVVTVTDCEEDVTCTERVITSQSEVVVPTTIDHVVTTYPTEVTITVTSCVEEEVCSEVVTVRRTVITTYCPVSSTVETQVIPVATEVTVAVTTCPGEQECGVSTVLDTTTYTTTTVTSYSVVTAAGQAGDRPGEPGAAAPGVAEGKPGEQGEPGATAPGVAEEQPGEQGEQGATAPGETDAETIDALQNSAVGKLFNYKILAAAGIAALVPLFA
ncbi:uncharacterized protein LODBEIA_P27420 [Lodderomyces beijingensis]|uniref:Hyphally-regulated cell wall protein N-terminal domain-containing protein n=1 Tax=Lodderomyces beijingensis TaxID=1775926 RepID=A0ABP0ZK48_9ASCO